ncbi:hypothetical protein [Cytobacillus sp. IB215665]
MLTIQGAFLVYKASFVQS